MTEPLPSQPTPFIGREDELAEIGRLLASPGCRLLTLSGPGGIGKTRLALQAADRARSSFPDGVFFAPLQPVFSTDFLVPAIADAVQLSFQASESAHDLLLKALRPLHALLVLDNFEHLLEAAPLISEILIASPQLKILVTSREVLELQEEWVRLVAGLSYPTSEDLNENRTFTAVELFQALAGRVRPDFSLDQERECVARICRLVQGMPLAIELAAAWLRSLPCSEIAAEIQNSLDFLETTLRNMPERHRSLRAVFEQSWKMLSADHQEVFKRLSIFHGDFERSAAQAVAGADLQALHNLVDKSLVRVAPAGRYEVHEVLRQFAQEKLGEDPAALFETRSRHCEYYAAFLQKREAELRGAKQAQALAAIEREIDNLRAAWRHAIKTANEQAVNQSMGSLLIYYHIRTLLEEGAEAFHRAVERWAGIRSPFLSDLYLHEAWFEAVIGRGPAAAYLYRKGLELLVEGKWQPTTPMVLAGITFMMYIPEEQRSKTESILSVFQRALAVCEQNGDEWGAAWMCYALAALAFYEENDFHASEQLTQRSADLFRKHGDLWASTFPLHHLGIQYEQAGKYLEARSIFHETLAICRHTGDAGGVEFALGQLSTLSAHEQDYPRSWQYLMDAIQVARRLQRDLSLTFHLFDMGNLLFAVGRRERSVEIFAFLCRFTPYESAQDYIRQRLEEIRPDVAPETFETARRRGEGLEIAKLVAMLAAEGPAAASLPPPSGALAALPGPTSALIEPLSPREREVLALVAAGLSNREIARKLVVTEGTVKKHINNIFGKLQVGSRTQAAARARDLRLLA